MRRHASLCLVLVLFCVAAGACRADGVRLGFRPAVGSRYAYRVEVRSEVVTQFADTPSTRRVDQDVLLADHAVLASGRSSSIVRVRLRGEGEPTRTFEVKLDRAAQLVEVERIEGLPASALGTLGLSEIFPAAAGAPPDRLLSPGERWEVDEPVSLPGAAVARLRGEGRLVALGVEGGRDVARVDTTYTLPVERTSEESQGRIVLRGSQRVRALTTSGVGDGALVKSSTEIRGRFDLSLLPREGGPPVPGSLEIVVTSVTRRVPVSG